MSNITGGIIMHKDIERILFSEEEIEEKCKELAKKIDEDYAQADSIFAIGLLKGSVPFMAELCKNIQTPLTMNYMQVSSYEGSQSGELKIKHDLEDSVDGKYVLIIEDILDTGKTLKTVKQLLLDRGAKEVKVVTLLDKVEGRQFDFVTDYYGFECPNAFVVGYGLDFNENYRQLPYVGVLKEECYK